jgi:hypothetical protein
MLKSAVALAKRQRPQILALDLRRSKAIRRASCAARRSSNAGTSQ